MTIQKRIHRLECEVSHMPRDLSEWSNEELLEYILDAADDLNILDWPPELAAFTRKLLSQDRL